MFAAILRNLLANAVKSCVGGGKIDITAELSSSHSVFCIRDNGIGMTKSRIDQLFAATRTSSGEVSKGYSNGFGLILCRDFITMNGGKLWAESREGQGTKVFFTFPVKTN
jgi:signal transduction histidine kinase